MKEMFFELVEKAMEENPIFEKMLKEVLFQTAKKYLKEKGKD